MTKQIHVAVSPLTNRIFAGTILKDGRTWGSGKQDVTGEACAAVAEHALAHEGGTIVVSGGGKPVYEIAVKKL